MAKTKTKTASGTVKPTSDMTAVAQGAKKISTGSQGLGASVVKLKTNLEERGVELPSAAGWVTDGKLLAPFVEGIKKAVKAEDELAKKGRSLKAPALAKGTALPGPPVQPVQRKAAPLPKVVRGETWTTLDKFNKSLDDISLKIGQTLLPAVNSIVKALTPVMTSIGQFVANNPYLVEGLAAAAVAFTVVTGAALGLVAVLGFVTSPIGIAAAAIAATVAVIVVAARFMTKHWAGIAGSFANVWQSITQTGESAVSSIKTWLDWKPREILEKTWGEARAYMSASLDLIGASVSRMWGGAKAAVVAGVSAVTAKAGELWSAFTSLFSWSPAALIDAVWQPLAGIFSALWDVLRASVAPLIETFKGLFDWSPVACASSSWEGVKRYFSELWAALTTGVQPVMDLFGSLFSQSPLGLIKPLWEPLLSWFSGLWEKLQVIVAPIKELLSDGIGGFVATITGQSSIAGANAPISAGLPGTLPQNSGTLIQQSAANNRTQLQGGLTVRFDNAPLGLRVDQAQTNQPGLSVNSRIGMRSLSLGGSNELA